MLHKFILSAYKEYLYFRNKMLCKINPKLAANIVYKKAFGKPINWENPQNLIEKILWMEQYTDTTLWTKCADKYRVREFVTERGCEETLVKLYGMWENPEDIDFDSLPNQFVLKANNGCGTVMIVKDKNKLNRKNTIKTLKSWLKRPFGYSSAQLHYLDIKRCIIAEELLVDNANYGMALNDYKIWCFNGEVESILVVHDRKGINGKDYKLSFFDKEWNNISEKALSRKNKHFWGGKIEKPATLGKMIETAQKLSTGIPEVRVDFYTLNDKVYFGELTFSTGYGTYSEEYYNYLGSKVDLSKLEKLPQKRV